MPETIPARHADGSSRIIRRYRLYKRLFEGVCLLLFAALGLGALLAFRGVEDEAERLTEGYTRQAEMIQLALAAALHDRIALAGHALLPGSDGSLHGFAAEDPLAAIDPAGDGFIASLMHLRAGSPVAIAGSVPPSDELAALRNACAELPATRGRERPELLPPVRDAAGNWLLPLAQATGGAQGCQGGIALLRSDFFSDFLRRLDVDFAVVVDRNGTILARHPDAQGQVGRTLGPSSVLAEAARHQPSGTMVSTSPVDGRVRIIAYSTLPDLPVILAAGFDYDRVEAAVAKRRSNLIALFAGLAVNLLLGATLARWFLFGWLDTRAALKLQEADFERRWQFAIDASHQGMWDWCARSGEVFCSRTGRKILGRDDRFERATPADWLRLVHREDRRAVRAALRRHLDGEAPLFEQRLRLRHGDGGWRWIRARGMAVERDAAGRPLRILGTFVDVTEEEEANLEMRLSATVFNQAAEGVMVTDAQNRIVKVNKAFTEVTGYTEEEVLGRNPRLLGSGRQDAAFYQAMWRTLQRKGNWRGEIWNRRKDGAFYAEWLSITAVRDEAGNVIRYVAVFSDITGLKKKEALIEHHAYYDSLTGLANRRLLMDRLEQEVLRAARQGSNLLLLFIDLDDFKDINDTMGHAAGDRVLTEAARRLQSCARDGDTVARLAGDEFVILARTSPDRAAAANLAEKVVRLLSQPVSLGRQEVSISASVGLACYPQDGATATALLASADRAMYAAKAEGRNCFRFHTPHMQEEAQERVQILTQLRRAIRDEEFQLHFQPIVDLASGRIVEAEALIRWRRPDGSMVPPGRFIPIAESTDLIVDIGEWTFRRVVAVLRRLQEAGVATEGLRLTVNKSPRHLMSRNTPRDWLAYLQREGVSPHNLTLEITEGLLLEENPTTLEKLRSFADAGVALAIDDFGTGYSAMSYLKTFPIQYVKIDRSFVSEIENKPQDLAITEAIVVMAHKLGLQTIAEGVETERQRQLLQAVGCDMGQGWLFARPMPEDDFCGLMARERAAGTEEAAAKRTA